MGSQGFRNIAGNPFVYQEDTRSAAFGLDAAAQKWKLTVKATAGALPTDTAQLTIDPAANGDVTVDPNGSGNFVVTSGNVSLTAGLLALPTASSTVGYITVNSNRVFHTYGTSNTFVGENSGNFTLTTGSSKFNTTLGVNCLPVLTTGAYNTAIGFESLKAVQDGSSSIAIGYQALYSNVSGAVNFAFGVTAGYNLTGSGNLILGSAAGFDTTSGSNNLYLGHYSGRGVNESNTLRIGHSNAGLTYGKINNTYISGIYGVTVGATNGLVYIDNGDHVGSTNSPSVTGSITAGTSLTASNGDLTLTSGKVIMPATTSTVGQIVINSSRVLHSYSPTHDANLRENVFLGYGAGNFTMSIGNADPAASYNVGIGAYSLDALTTGYQNCAVGSQALGACTTGLANNAVGSRSLAACIDGTFNNAMGQNALNALTSGTCNCGVGTSALQRVTTGGHNCCIGTNAGYNYTSSEANNIIIGELYGTTGESNVIRIGTDASSGVTPSQTKCYIGGIYGVTPGGTQNIALIDSNGQLGSTATLSPAYGGAMTWTEVTGTSQAAAVNNGYITNNVALVTVTLPSTAAVGQRVRIGGKGAGLWKLAQNSGQVIHFGSIDTTTGAGGYLAATVKYDTVEVICITANTDWLVLSSSGSITIV